MSSSATPPAPNSHPPVLLGPVEGIFWRLERASAGSFRVTGLLRLDGWIEADCFAKALHRLQQRHPKLRAAIEMGDDGNLRFRFAPTVPPIPCEITDIDEGETPWREAAVRLMQKDFPAAGPLAAVSVLRTRRRNSSEVLLTVHHAIADGLSAIMLLTELLTEYAAVETEPELSPRPVLPVVVAPRAKASGGWRGRLWLLRRLVRMRREDNRSRQTMLPEAKGIPPLSQWVHWVFSREETLDLIRCCRREKASLGAALVAAAFCAVMDCLVIPEALLKCTFTFDIRPVIKGPAGPVTREDLGCFSSIMNEFYEVRQQPVFWQLARRAQQDQQTFVKHGGPAFYYNLAAAARLAEKTIAARKRFVPEPEAKRVTLHAAYLGALSMRDSYGSLRPRECTGVFQNSTIGPSLLLETLVLGQQLNIGLAGDNLEPAFWQRFQEAFRKRLAAAIRHRQTPTVEL